MNENMNVYVVCIALCVLCIGEAEIEKKSNQIECVLFVVLTVLLLLLGAFLKRERCKGAICPQILIYSI